MYKLLLRLLPRRLRRDIEDEMAAVFSQSLEDARRHGRTNVVRAWIREVLSLLRFALRERGFRASFGETAGQEIRWVVRSLRLRGGTTAWSIALMTVGLVASTLVFATIDALALRGMPYPNAARLTTIAPQDGPGRGLSQAIVQQLLHREDVLSSVAAYGSSLVFIQSPEGFTRVPAIDATPAIMDVLGSRAAWGRTFSSNDATRQDADVVLLAESLARRLFGQPEAAVGQTLQTDELPLFVAGVMPSAFRFPNGVPELWRVIDAAGPLAKRRLSLLGVAPNDASPEAISTRLSEWKDDPDGPLVATRAHWAGESPERFAALIMAALCLWLIAAANVTTLQAVTIVGRRKVMEIQHMLGAGRLRLVWSAVLESALVVSAAAVAAVGLLFILFPVLTSTLPGVYATVPVNPIHFDQRAWQFLLGACALSLVITATPAAVAAGHTARRAPVLVPGRGSSRPDRTTATRTALTVAQIAALTVLATGAALFIQTYRARLDADKGFDSRNLVDISSTFPTDHLALVNAAWPTVLDRVQAHPAVVGVTSASIPSAGDSPEAFDQVLVDGHVVQTPKLLITTARVPADYHDFYGMRFVEGRAFKADEPDSNVIISRPLAERLFPSGAIGHTLSLTGQPARVVIGVVEHARTEQERHGSTSRAVVYAALHPRPLLARPAQQAAIQTTRVARRSFAFRSVIVRLQNPEALSEVLAVVRVQLPGYRVTAEWVDDQYAGWESDSQVTAFVLMFFGSVAGPVCSIGLYSVLLLLVAQRRSEFGVRLALGASAVDIGQLVATASGRVVGMGLALGLGVIVATGHLFEPQLFGIGPYDPATLGLVAIAIVCVAIMSSVRPTTRAMRVDPVSVLKLQ